MSTTLNMDGIKDSAALALIHLAEAPERKLAAYHHNAANRIRTAANLAGVTDYRLRAMTGPDVWVMLFPHDRDAGARPNRAISGLAATRDAANA